MHCLTGGGLDFAALMASRPLDAVRAVIYVPEVELKDYLTLIDHPGISQELLDLVTELSQLTYLRYNLDISRRVLSGIGIECFLKDRKKAHRSKWERFLEYLAGRSLCIPGKKKALMDWLGHAYVALPQDTEPYYIFRRIDHMKVAYEKGKPLQAKAYPEFFRITEMDLMIDRIAESCRAK